MTVDRVAWDDDARAFAHSPDADLVVACGHDAGADNGKESSVLRPKRQAQCKALGGRLADEVDDEFLL